MNQSRSVEESPGTGSVGTTGSPSLRRSAREMPGKNTATPVNQSPPLVRKSERLKKNSPEASLPQRNTDRVESQSSMSPLRRSERGKNQSPLKSNEKSDKSTSMSIAKVRTQRVNAGNSEDVGAKRRKLDAKRFKSLFGSNNKKFVSTEPSEKPKLSRTLAQSYCRATETEAEDKHRSVNNQSENKLMKKSESFVKDPDLREGLTPEIQSREVKRKLSELNIDHEYPASSCKANLVELGSSTRIRSKIQSEGDLTVPDKDGPMECATDIHAYVQEDSPLSPSHDNRGSTLHVASDKVELSDESRVKSKPEAATSKEKLLHVNVEDEETIHSRERDADDINHIAAVSDLDPAICSDSSNVSHSRNEANDSSERSASSPRSHRFVEYWVPARVSNLQLEQYCAALLTNSISLCSSLKSDPVGALRNLLITLRKTCNHPFLVDPDLSASLLKDRKETEYLDVGIKASGKLQLLEAMLLEMRKRGLRVLILYESSIYARDTIGDILDDFLLQRYGQDSFEHVDGGGSVPSKKQAALNRFNDKEFGRFVFLLETRACASSIKLSSVDSIIIFNSDWNPVNDLRSLQKIVLESHHYRTNVIRLFLPLTVEENAMILSKRNVTIDNNMHNISLSHRDKLLIRGASALFDELERFHRSVDSVPNMISSLESSLLQDVVQELMTILLENGRHVGDGLSTCLKIQRSGGGNGKFQLVPDELETLLVEERWPLDFWSQLLKERSPRWKYVSDSNKRKRKIVHYNESEDVKRHRKVVHDSMDVTSVVENQKVVTSDKGSRCAKHLSQVIAEDVCFPSELHNTALESSTIFEESNKLLDTKKSLHILLKPELQKLCELLNFSEDVKKMAELFLEYVMENHLVTREPVTLLQAFQMSVCWIAASLRKQKINCQESLALARRHLNFCCSAEDTDYVYLKMVLLKEMFLHSTVDDNVNGHACNTVFPVRDTSDVSLIGLNLVTSESKSPRVFDAEKLLVKTIRHINKKCRERMKILIQNQRKETEELQKSIDEEKAQLEHVYKVEVAVVRTIHAHNLSMAAEKLKALGDQYSKRLEEHRNNLNIRSKSLEDKHLSEKDEENELTSRWKEDFVKEQVELLRKLTFKDSENGKIKLDSSNERDVLDSRKECALEDQEVLKSRPDVLAERIEECQSTTPEESLALPPTSSDAGNDIIVVDSVVSTSAKVLPENSAIISSETRQVASLACGQAANFVDLTSDMEVPETSSVDVLPLKLSYSELTDGPSPGKTLDCLTTSQLLSSSAVLIPGSGLLNPPTTDVPQALSCDKSISVQHESKALSAGPSVLLPSSLVSLDNEIDNSSLVSSLKAVNGLPPSQLNVEALVTEGQPEIPFSSITSGFEQSDLHIQLCQSVVHTTDHSDVDLTAKAMHQLPGTEKQPQLPSCTTTTGSKQSDSDIQLLHTAVDLSNVDPSAAEAVVQSPATEGQPEFPSSNVTSGSEKSNSDVQFELLSHTATDHFNVEPSTAEAVHQLPATEGQPEFPSSSVTPGSEKSDSDIQRGLLYDTATDHFNVGPSTSEAVSKLPATEAELPCSVITSGYEQDHSDIQLDESLLHSTSHSNVEPSAPGAVLQLPATEEQLELLSSTVTGSEQYHSKIQLDQSLLRTATGLFDPSAGEAVHVLPATEGEAGLPSSITTPEFEQSQSDTLLDRSLLHASTEHSNINPSAAEAVHQLSATEEQLELPSSAMTLRSEQFDSDNQFDQLMPHSATDHSNVEPSAGEAVHQMPHSPLVDSSSSQQHSSLPLSEELPSGGSGTTLNADAPNPSPSPSVVNVSFISPTCIAISQSSSNSGPRATADIPTSLISGVAIPSTVSARMPMSSYLDPLQSELERIQKEADHSVQKYEEMKQLLNSECEKEIGEIVAQVRKKYETKNVELDAALKYKKNELDAYHSKVYMNRMLAEIFRNKCMEPKVFVPPGMPQDNVQRQLHRHPPESAPRPPVIANTPSAVHASGNLQGTHSSMPHRHPAVRGASSAAPTTRNMQSTQNLLRSSDPSAASSQNSLRHGGPSAASSQIYLRPGVPAAPVSFSAIRMTGSLQASHNSMRPGVTSGISPATPLPRSSSSLPSTSPVPRIMGTSPAVQQTMSRPVQAVNHSSALFSGNSARTASTTSTTPPTVNLHSVSGIRAPAPHLRSRVSQPVAPNTNFSTSIRSLSTHPPYSNVYLSAPSTVNKPSSYHRAPAPQSANGTVGIQQVPTIDAHSMPSNIENEVRNGMAVNVSNLHSNMPLPPPPTPPNNGGTHNLPPTSVSTAAQVVCLSDDD